MMHERWLRAAAAGAERRQSKGLDGDPPAHLWHREEKGIADQLLFLLAT